MTSRDAFLRVPPIYFIGDSRTVPFRNAVYTSGRTARSYQLRSVHLRALHAADFCSRERGLNGALVNALATDEATLSRDAGATWNATHWGHAGSAAAPLVLFCGAYDVHRLMDELGPDADIAAWDERSSRFDESTRPASRRVCADELRPRVREIMEPFALGIGALGAMGFDGIFVHGFPPSRWGERFRRLYGEFKWLRQYHPNAFPKAHLLFDEAVRAIAERTRARYVPGPVDAHGELPPEQTSDDVHYTADGAREVARFVVSAVEGVRA